MVRIRFVLVELYRRPGGCSSPVCIELPNWLTLILYRDRLGVVGYLRRFLLEELCSFCAIGRASSHRSPLDGLAEKELGLADPNRPPYLQRGLLDGVLE